MYDYFVVHNAISPAVASAVGGCVAAAELQKLEQQQGFDSMRESLSILGASCGFGFSFADVLLTHCLHWAKTIGWLPAPTGTSAVLHRYLGQMTARSAYQRVAKAAGF